MNSPYYDPESFNPTAYQDVIGPNGNVSFAPTSGGAFAGVSDPAKYFPLQSYLDQNGEMTPELYKQLSDQLAKQNAAKSDPFSYAPLVIASLFGGAVAGAGAGAGGAAGAGGGAGGVAGGIGAADVAGLTQMGIDAGLGGSALDSFVASGGAANIGIPAGGAGGIDWGRGADFNRLVNDYGIDNGGLVSSGGGLSVPPGATSAISRILNGTATSDDWLRIGGTLGSTILGVAGGNSQANAAKDIYNTQLGLGAPYRDLLQKSYLPGFTMNNEPGYTSAIDSATDAYTRMASAGKLSGAGPGNPIGNPGAWAETLKKVEGNVALPALQNYRAGLAGAGQLGTQNLAALGTNVANSTGNVYNAIGSGLADLTNPKTSLEDLLKRLGSSELGYKTVYS